MARRSWVSKVNKQSQRKSRLVLSTLTVTKPSLLTINPCWTSVSHEPAMQPYLSSGCCINSQGSLAFLRDSATSSWQVWKREGHDHQLWQLSSCQDSLNIWQIFLVHLHVGEALVSTHRALLPAHQFALILMTTLTGKQKSNSEQ